MKARQYILAMGLPLLLVACAYQRPAELTAQIARTEAVLQQAERSGVEVNALPELLSARNKFADAQRAMSRNNKSGDQQAMQLAKQAEVDAQFASAKAQSIRQQEAAREVQDGVRALQEESQRRATNPAPAPR